LLTAAERRGALILALLMSLGTFWDVWHSHRAPRRLEESPLADSAAAPARGAPEMPAGPSAGSALGTRKREPAEPVDLNRAEAAELARLPGIGPVLAARIVQARLERGSFERPEDLLTVRGIGPRLFERLSPHLRPFPVRLGVASGAHAFRTGGPPDSVQILLQSRTPAFR
jgi:competence ComEA-like helix-hairpin-helix protein